MGRRQPRCRRRRRAHPHGAPRQHRPVADVARRAWHRDPLGAAHLRRPARPHRPRPAPRRGQGVLVHRDEQRARHTPARRSALRSRPRCRRARGRRRLPIRPAQRHRRPGLGCRPRRFLEPQDVRSVRHRDAVGPHGTARRDAALPRWRQHDRHRHARRIHLRSGSGEVRGRHSPDRRSGRPARSLSSSSRTSAWTTSASTRSTSPATPSTR